MNDKTEQTMTDVLPCPFCGSTEGFYVVKGSTFSWRAITCRSCGEGTEVRHKNNSDEPDSYIADWNAAAPYPAVLRKELDTLRAQLAEAQAALKTVMRNAELSKEPCGPDPESPAAVRNAKFASLSSIAAQGLGMVSGPSLTAQLAEAQRNAERWSRAAHCARLDQFGGFVVTPDEPAFASDVSLAFIRAIDAAIGAAKGPT